MSKGYIGPVGPIPEESDLIYDPHRRYQAWRFLTYMLVHAGWTHIIFNVLIQVVLGIPLEMVHHWWRIMLIYFLGVIAGSLGTSISDPTVYLVGASAGVYALMSAHLSSVILVGDFLFYGMVDWFSRKLLHFLRNYLSDNHLGLPLLLLTRIGLKWTSVSSGSLHFASSSGLTLELLSIIVTVASIPR
jgi:hypothetical protein